LTCTTGAVDLFPMDGAYSNQFLLEEYYQMIGPQMRTYDSGG